MDWTQVGIKAVIGGVIAAATKLSIDPILDWQTLMVTIGAAFVLGALNVINQYWPVPVSASRKKQGFIAKLRAAL
jgi:hypothetical protein